MGLWVYRFMGLIGLWAYGLMGLWAYGFMGLWAYGFRVQGLGRLGCWRVWVVWGYGLEVFCLNLYTP